MPESVCLSMILGNALGRSLSPSSNFWWCICFTDPCGSRRKPGADKRNIVVDGIGGEVLSKALALGGSLTTLGYSASRKTTIASQISSCHKSASGISTCSVNGGRPLQSLGTQLSLYFNPARSNRLWLRRSLWLKRLRLSVISLKAAPWGGSSSQSESL